MTRKSDLNEVIGLLYDAAAFSEKWPVFLQGLALQFGASSAKLVHLDPTKNQIDQAYRYGPKATAAQLARFRKGFVHDPRVLAIRRRPAETQTCCVSRVVETGDQPCASKKAPRFKKADVSSLFVGVFDENGGLKVIILTRREEAHTAFNQEDCDAMDSLVPHLKRAFELQRRLVDADYTHRTAMEVVDHIPMGIVVVTEGGAIKQANASARDIAERKDGLSLSGGHLSLLRQEDHADLINAISRTIGSTRGDKNSSGHMLTVSRDEGREGYPLMVASLSGEHEDLRMGVDGEPAAMVFITDPDRRQETPANLLQRLYGLTPAESKVLEYLVTSCNLETAAQMADITTGTARQYVKTILQKTQTNRQVDLVKKVVTSPLWMHNLGFAKDAAHQ